jgi:hypothetical protein
MPLVTRLRRTGFRKGVQGNRTWLALGTVIWGAQKLRQLAKRDAEILVREELKPGDRMIISNGRVTVDRVEGPDPSSGRARQGRSRNRRSKKEGRQSKKRSRSGSGSS